MAASSKMKVSLAPAPPSAAAVSKWGLPSPDVTQKSGQTEPGGGSSLIKEGDEESAAIDPPPGPSQAAVASDAVARLFLRQGKLDPDDLLNARAPGGSHCWHWAVTNGRADVVRWLLTQEGLTDIINLQADNEISPSDLQMLSVTDNRSVADQMIRSDLLQICC